MATSGDGFFLLKVFSCSSFFFLKGGDELRCPSRYYRDSSASLIPSRVSSRDLAGDESRTVDIPDLHVEILQDLIPAQAERNIGRLEDDVAILAVRGHYCLSSVSAAYGQSSRFPTPMA